MKNTIVNYLSLLKKDRSRQRKMGTLLACLSLVVAGGVVWSLHMTGESQTAETWCGYTEHQHSEECTEKMLVCGYDTEGTAESEQVSSHMHTDACYETQAVLTCVETEHTHSAENGCYDEDGNLTCQIPEHTHSEENGCYTTDSVLICGLEEGGAEPAESQTESSGHVHTDECYEITYICGKEEHQHKLSCFSNPEADVETAADWEKTFADVELTGVYADDVLAIAKTQLGYTESTKNYQVVLDEAGNETEEIKGYTRYGAWYRAPYGDWCAMFVSFCLNYAEVPTEAFPRDASCPNWIETLYDPEDGYELYEAAEGYTPEPGDLVFFDWDEDGSADHVGIVSELTPEYTGTEESYKDDPEYTLTGFKTIEGNSENKVKENKYKLTDETILGYGKLPENPELAGEDAEEETRTITADAGDGVTVTAVGKIPEGAYLKAQKLAEDQIAYLGEALADITLGEDSFAYDIKILSADGKELELGRNIRVTISGLEIAGNAEVSGYHLTDVDADSLTDAESAAVEELDVSAEKDGISFITDGFSVMLFSVYGSQDAATYEPIQINSFDVVFSSGGKLTDTNGDGTKDAYVWTATDSAAGHEFVYRVDYTLSGHEIAKGEFVITLPLHLLKTAAGAAGDSFDCAYLREDEVAAGDTPDFVYRIEGDYVYIYNYSDIPAGQSGYIEFSYTTTEPTYNYVDLGEQTKTLDATLDIGVPVGEVIQGAKGTGTDQAHDDASTAGVNIDTGVTLTSTSKQTPTRYTEWQSSWGDKPSDADDDYYFVWPIYTVISKGTQKYDLTLTDTFSDFGGQVLAYRFAGSSEWVAPDPNADPEGSATVKGLTPTNTTGRYDYVLVSCSKDEILEYLKEQYSDCLNDENAKTLEDAENALFKSGKYTMSYTIKNKIEAKVHPADGKDKDTSDSATKTYTYEVPPYENPVGIFYADKWGIYQSSTRVYSSEDISSYKLTEFLKGEKYDTIPGLKYYNYVHGYPGLFTLDGEVTKTSADAENFFKKSVTYSLADNTFSLKALTYESNYSDGGMSISGESQTLDVDDYDDYDVTSLQWSATVQTAEFNPTTHTWDSTTVTDFNTLPEYEPEGNLAQNTLYFYVYVKPENATEYKWLLAATYDLANGIYITDGMDGEKYINTKTASGASGTITFKGEVKGYKIETSNPFYYTKIGAYPTITLNRTDHVAQILLGSDDATVDNLVTMAHQDPEVLTKIAVTNTANGTITQGDDNLYTRSPSGTDYVSALVRHSTLSKRVASTVNNKRDRQYEITWSVTLNETYTDDTGSHNVPQESGTFYDLLPAGGILDPSSVKVTCSSGKLNAGAYELEEIDNYNDTGRTMLKVTIYEPTSTSYILTYTTTHSWDAVKDYGKKVLNSVAYETGNEDIGDGGSDNGGDISERNLMKDLTETTDDNTDTTEKFRFAEASWSISNLVAANTGLLKQVKASGDAAYSYSTVVSAGGTYSYQIRFANDSMTASDDVMIFDSLEYFHQNYDSTKNKDGNAAILSDWEGSLTGIDTSQLTAKFGTKYTIYVSEVEDLNFYELNGTVATGENDSGVPKNLDKNYDFEADTTAKWVKLSAYKTANDGDLSKVKAIAVDLRGNRLAAGDSVTYTLYMKAPTGATDEDYDYDNKVNKNDDTITYPDPVTYNNIYVSRTALKVTTDEDTGLPKVDETSATPNFFHQDYTQVRFRAVADVLLLKVSEYDTTKVVPGAVYLLSGTSDYGTVYEEKVTSNSSGLISFTDIELGTYTLKEIDCGSDWLLNKEEYTVTVYTETEEGEEEGQVKASITGYGLLDEDRDGECDTRNVNGKDYFLLTDEPRVHAPLSFSKADSITKQPVTGAEFKLYGQSDYGTDVLLYATSDNTGTVTFADVEKGSYTMVETQAPEGYILSTTVWKVTVDKEGVARLSTDAGDSVETGDNGSYLVTNEKYHQVQFMKRSTYGKNNYIAGIEFTLSGTSDYGNPYEQTAVSSETLGLVTFDQLEPGTYELKETNTSGAKDSTWEDKTTPEEGSEEEEEPSAVETSGSDEETETSGKNGLSYPVNAHSYTVRVEADGSYTISGLDLETVTLGNTEENLYVFENTPESGVITVTKVWLDDVKDEDRSPTDLDITISTEEPSAADYGGLSITFDANEGGAFTDKRTTRNVAYTTDGTRLGGGSFEKPTATDSSQTFDHWYALVDDGGEKKIITVTVNDDGYPIAIEDTSISITPGEEGLNIWKSVGENGGYTLTLYAKYESTAFDYNMKYAVRLYGIGEDVDENGNTLALTFGPATGEDYRYLGENVSGTDAATYGSGSGYVAHCAKGEGTCLHWMTWEQIAATNNKAEAFADCLKNGCTHSVLVDLNETLLRTTFTTDVTKWTGDGAGMFYTSIKSQYSTWNEYYNFGGWAISRVRYTLNGIEKCDFPEVTNVIKGRIYKYENYKTEYSGENYSLSYDVSLLSCFEPDLKDVIVAAKKASSTGYKDGILYSENGVTTNDKLWLFSWYELSENKTDGLYADGEVTYSDRQKGKMKLYCEEYAWEWWLRSADVGQIYVAAVDNKGECITHSATYSIGLAPGFCIGTITTN